MEFITTLADDKGECHGGQCVRCIENKEYDEALTLYKEMTFKLKDEIIVVDKIIFLMMTRSQKIC